MLYAKKKCIIPFFVAMLLLTACASGKDAAQVTAVPETVVETMATTSPTVPTVIPWETSQEHGVQIFPMPIHLSGGAGIS